MSPEPPRLPAPKLRLHAGGDFAQLPCAIQLLGAEAVDEIMLYVLMLVLFLTYVIAVPVLLIVLLVRTQRLKTVEQRLRQLEVFVRTPLGAGQIAARVPPQATPTVVGTQAAGLQVAAAEATSEASVASSGASPTMPSLPRVTPAFPPTTAPSGDLQGLEQFIGRKALGWVAVIVLVFATGFFLRYAFQNRWIGPIGQVTLGNLGGLALVVAGARYFVRGRRIFSQMFVAAGIVLMYLATYSSFGFYHLVPQRVAGLFLFVLVVESGLLALRCNSPAVALVAVLGGLLTPLLMHSDHDQYVSLFVYLGALNAGVAALLSIRSWPAIGTVALVGTQGLFWFWYGENYHPEKFAWTLGFQIVIFALYFLRTLAIGIRDRRSGWEDLLVSLGNAVWWSAAAYVLLRSDYRPWLATGALAMATIYAIAARLLLGLGNGRLLFASLAIAASYIALALPLQADAPWVAIGWAAEAAVLWWCGLRVRSTSLRAMAAPFAVAAVVRLLAQDEPIVFRDPFWPLLNEYALTGLATVACLAAPIILSRRWLPRLATLDRVALALGTVACTLLVWWIVSVDLFGYFQTESTRHLDSQNWRRLGQLCISAWWAIYAGVVLGIGFKVRAALLRWTALGLFAITIAKVFFIDMAGLDQLYRIVAFFVLAVLLGISAWAYQRSQVGRVAEAA